MQFGYLRDENDSKDWQFSAFAAPLAKPLPVRLSYESVIGPAYDQGETFECVCFAVAGLQRYYEIRQGRPMLDFDAHGLYARCKALDGHPDTPGTFPRVALDVLRKEGIHASDGNTYRVAACARLSSVDEIRHALATQGPVILGIRIDPLYFADLGTAEFNEANVDPSHFSGHCMLAVGYDDNDKALRIRNSWGLSWGDSGHFCLPYDYLNSVDPAFDAWSSVDA